MRLSRALAAALLLVVPAARAQAQADVSVVNYTLANAQPGGPIVYLIEVRNGGPADATGITLTDAIPPNTTFIAEQHPAGAACSSPAAGGKGILSCTMAALHATARFYLNIQVDPAVASGTIISNTSTVSSANDPNAENNSATATTTVSGPLFVSTDLSVTSGGPAIALAGTPVNYSVTVTNNGPADAVNVAVVDGIPENSTFVSASQTSGAAFNCVNATPGSRGGMRCAIGVLPIGASAAFTVAARVDPGCPTKIIFNDALITSDTANLIGTSESTTNTHVTAVPGTTADLSVMIRPNRSAPPGGLIVSYIDVLNTGPADATQVTLTYPVPPETTFLGLTNPSGTTCSTPPPGGAGTVTCTIPSLVNEGSMTFAVSIGVSTKPAVTAISDAASVESASADPDPTYNSAVVMISIDVADLAVSATPESLFVMPGGNIVYMIRVTNAGPAASDAVVVKDTIPAGTTFVSATPSQGSCAFDATATCSLGTIASGNSATIKLTVTAPASGTVVNTVTAGSSTADASIKNNVSTSTVTVIAGPCSRRLRLRC